MHGIYFVLAFTWFYSLGFSLTDGGWLYFIIGKNYFSFSKYFFGWIFFWQNWGQIRSWSYFKYLQKLSCADSVPLFLGGYSLGDVCFIFFWSWVHFLIEIFIKLFWILLYQSRLLLSLSGNTVCLLASMLCDDFFTSLLPSTCKTVAWK